jgi:hypothetical protein
MVGILLFILCSFSLNAQQDEYATDTVSIDTTVISDYPVADDEYVEEESVSRYFIPKSGFPDSFHFRELPDTVSSSLRKDEDFWYADVTVKKTITKPGENQKLTDQSWFQSLLWVIIIGGFGVFVMLYLSNSNIGLFRKKNMLLREGDDFTGTEDIFAINYQKEIDRAAGSSNYRLAIRLMFLRLLKNLSEKNIIQYKPDRTNLDYLHQLSSTRYYHDFFRITRNYEYSWYGQFQVTEETYKIIKTDMERFDPSTK